MSSIHGGYTAPAREEHRSSFERADAAASDAFSGLDDVIPVIRRGRVKWIIPLAVTAGYALFALAVHLRLLDNLDVAVRHASPPGVWGPTQARAARFVSALQPSHLAVPFVLVVAAVGLLRRSLRPFVVVATVGVPVVIATLGSKWVMQRWDPNIFPVGHGSFPSGHTVGVVIAFGLVVLLVRPGTRWGWTVPVVMGCLMGGALILAQIHPATDVIGAGLLTVAALTFATAAGLGQWAGERQQGSVA